jgi:DNA-binding MarR family transcriptional regulator
MNDSHTVFSDLVRLETELWNEIDARLRSRHGLTMAAYDAQRVIAETPGCRVVDIATALAISIGGTSKLVDRLVEAGQAGRRANPDDRRSSVVELTSRGRALLEEGRGTVEAALGELLVAPLSAAEVSALGELLTRLRGHFAVTAGAKVAP